MDELPDDWEPDDPDACPDCGAPNATWYDGIDGELWALCQQCGYHSNARVVQRLATGPFVGGVRYCWFRLPTGPELARFDAMRAERRAAGGAVCAERGGRGRVSDQGTPLDAACRVIRKREEGERDVSR